MPTMTRVAMCYKTTQPEVGRGSGFCAYDIRRDNAVEDGYIVTEVRDSVAISSKRVTGEDAALRCAADLGFTEIVRL